MHSPMWPNFEESSAIWWRGAAARPSEVSGRELVLGCGRMGEELWTRLVEGVPLVRLRLADPKKQASGERYL